MSLDEIPDSQKIAMQLGGKGVTREDAQIMVVILARGGSSRCLRKNARTFCGRPMIAWAVIGAKAAHHVTDVYLSTDDAELAEIGKHYGAQIMMRDDPRESDTQTSGGIPSHSAVQKLRKMRRVDAVMTVFPNCPLRKPDDWDRLINAWHDRGRPARSVSLFAPKDETFLYRKIDDRYMRTLVMDKYTGRFWDLCPGIGCDGNPGKYDLPIDWRAAGMGDIILTESQPTWPILGEQDYIEGEWWQTYEIDTEDQFHLCEYLMYAHVLNQGEDIYERYASEA